MMNLQALATLALDALLPPACSVCHRPLAAGRPNPAPICTRCKPRPISSGHRCHCCFSPVNSATVTICQRCSSNPSTPSSSALYRQRHLWIYEGNAQAVLATIKAERRPNLCRWAAAELAEHLFELFPAEGTNQGNANGRVAYWDLILPTPTPILTRIKRGFNPAEILAKAVAKSLNPKLLTLGQLTIQKQRGQAGLNAAQRERNSRKMKISVHLPVRGCRVLLIDDVRTTGATARAIAQKLLEEGACSVDLLTLAGT